MLNQILSFFSIFNFVDFAIAIMFFISVMIAARMGVRKEVMLLVMIVLPAMAVAFLPHDMLDDYISELIPNPSYSKMCAQSVIYIVFFFMSAVLKRNIGGERIRYTKILSVDGILGAVFGFIRGCVVLAFLLAAHAHFCPKPVYAIENSYFASLAKKYLISLDERFELYFEHTDQVAFEMEAFLYEKGKNKKKANKKSAKEEKDQALIDNKVVDIDADEHNPDIEP